MKPLNITQGILVDMDFLNISTLAHSGSKFAHVPGRLILQEMPVACVRRQHPRSWQHPHGAAETVKSLTGVLSTAIHAILVRGEAFYPSIDMKVGRSAPHLVTFMHMLMGLMTLDPRGGHFLQGDMERAVGEATKDAQLEGTMTALASSSRKEVKDVKNLIAYKIRVMCSHAREMRHDCDMSSDLKPLFDIMRGDAPASSSGDAAPAPPIAATGFFLNLKLPEESANDESDPEDGAPAPSTGASEVAKYFDGYLWKARKIFSDGTFMTAETYKQGDGGLAIAVFGDGDELLLEVPNSCVKEDGGLKGYTPPERGLKKRPAAEPAAARKKKHQSEADDNSEMGGNSEEVEAVEEGVEDVEKEEEEESKKKAGDAGRHVKLVVIARSPGAVLFLRSTLASSDQAQVLEIKPNKCEKSSLTPAEVCAQVMEAHQDNVKDIPPPIKHFSGLRDLRTTLRNEAQRVLEQSVPN